MGMREVQSHVHRLHRVRQAPVQAGHRRLYRPRTDAGEAGDNRGGRGGCHSAGSGGDRAGDRGRRVPVAAKPGRHPHEHRAAAVREDRRCRRTAPHRSLAERPGGAGRADVRARELRRRAGAVARPAGRAGRPCVRQLRCHNARLHAPAAGRSRCSSLTTCSPTSRCSAGTRGASPRPARAPT